MNSNNTLIEISDLLDGFSLIDISDLIKNQILNTAENDYDGIKIDHFKPIYVAYKKLVASDGIPDEEMQDARDRFYDICNLIIALIENRYNFIIDENWLANNAANVPAIALALYDFFIINFYSNLLEVLQNYIVSHEAELVATFNELKSKKDAASMANRKILSPDMAVIVANIYDINDWILNNMDEHVFLDMIDDGYFALTIIRDLYDNGNSDGEFVKAIHEIYKNSLPLKSQVGFDIAYRIRTGVIQDTVHRVDTTEEV